MATVILSGVQTDDPLIPLVGHRLTYVGAQTVPGQQGHVPQAFRVSQLTVSGLSPSLGFCLLQWVPSWCLALGLSSQLTAPHPQSPFLPALSLAQLLLTRVEPLLAPQSSSSFWPIT